ncbi:MAG TPA: glycerol-3-phosphate 1-O-acyltransferase PlsY [Terriglobales bacterium]|nr:glycerol-3-phosphate 1-O-acyltransferase PlsY [Terriglobales bacterium]
MLIYFTVALVSYLLGSIPFGYILVRVFRGEDVRATGSGNIGATNVMRSGSKGLGIATLILDAGKGYLAVVASYSIVAHFFGRGPVLLTDADTIQHYIERAYMVGAVAAVFAIIGHIFPIWLRFKGGKGVATGVGSFLSIAPKAVGVVLLLFIAIVAISRYVSLGSIIATAAFPICAWVLYRGTNNPLVFGTICTGSVLIIAKHYQNIRRLLAGSENRFGGKKGASA